MIRSDIDTIVNICSTSPTNRELCNNKFWEHKFRHDRLPILSQANSLKEWVKLYKTTELSILRAEQIIKIISTYNRYKGLAVIKAWYENKSMLPGIFYDYFELEKISKTNRIQIIYEFDRKQNKWEINIDEQPPKIMITDKELMDLLTISIYDRYEGHSFSIADFEENELLYEELLKKSKQNKPIPRAYLMAYELIMEK